MLPGIANRNTPLPPQAKILKMAEGALSLALAYVKYPAIKRIDVDVDVIAELARHVPRDLR